MEKSWKRPELSNENLWEMLDALPGSVYVFLPDEDDSYPVYMNQGCLHMLEVDTYATAYSFCNGNFWKYVDPADQQSVREVYERLKRAVGTKEAFDCSILTHNGNRHLIRVVARSQRTSLGKTLILDYTMDLYATPEGEQDSGIDRQTGLLNMHAFLRTLQQAENASEKTPQVILYLDLVNFQRFNRKSGIARGDQFLRAVGACIHQCFPGSPAAHFDADHFAFLAEEKDILPQAQRLREMIRKMAPDVIDCSIGACRLEGRDLAPETACARAKIACDDNRKHPSTYFSFYTDRMGEALETAEYVTSNIDEAIRQGWIRVYYQPILRAVSGQLCSMEALARWDDPKRGLLPPISFIGPLEQAQLVWKLDLCVIRQVVENIADRCTKGLPEIPVSVNLSRMDFLCCDLVQEIEGLVRRYDIPRRMLHLEVTESALASHEDRIRKALDQFRSAGYEIWMDDFGSGYSTLNLLKDYSFDVLKLDMEFLRNDSVRSREIITSVIAMDTKIGIRTLAEGVETKEQMEFLKKCGCEKLQGYYIGKPMPFEEALSHCAEKGYRVESEAEKRYYGAVEKSNFLTETPLFLLDCGDTAKILAMNAPAQDLSEADGLFGMEEVQRYLDAWLVTEGEKLYQAEQYAAAAKREGEILVRMHGRERLLRFRHLSDLRGHRLLEVRVEDHTGYLEELSRKARTLMNLLGLYRSIYSIDAQNLTIRNLRYFDAQEKGTGGETLLLDDGALQVAIFPADRSRYLSFLDPKTLPERIAKAPDGILSGIFRTKDESGTYRWMSHRLFFAADSGRKEILYLIRAMDVATTKEELNLQKSDPYRTLTMEQEKGGNVLWDDMMMNIPIPMFWKDKNRRFLGASRSFLSFFGYSDISEILGKTDEEVGWHPNGEEYRKDELAILKTGQMCVQVPGRCIANGKAHTIYATKWPTYQGGKISGLMGFFLEEKTSAHGFSDRPAPEENTGSGEMRSVAEFLQDFSDYECDSHLNGQTFGVISLSVPALQRIAGSQGHDAMNKVLAACEAVIRENVRNNAVAARFDVGKFGILCAAGSEDELKERAEKIRRQIEDIHWVENTTCTLFVQVRTAFGNQVSALWDSIFSAFFSDSGKEAEPAKRGNGKLPAPAKNRWTDLTRALDDIPFGSYLLRPDHTVLYWNREAETLLGYSREEILGRRCVDMSIGCSFVTGGFIQRGNCPAVVAYTTGRTQTMQMFMRCKDGKNILVRNTLIPLRGAGGEITELLSLFLPVVDGPCDQTLVRDIYEVATRDPLTCLPGRRYMESCIEEELERFRRTGHPFAVLFADANNFHDVNNTYGHTAGDALLRIIGLDLRKYGRRTDRFCRWGGDEFVGLLQLRDPGEIEQAAKRFLKVSHHEEIDVDGVQISCQAAIGITVARTDDDVKSIVSRADRYMYQAKQNPEISIVTDASARAET
ncbi:MAG: EAL domain-containing protein [Lachnospiraceae bacterium]